MILLFDIIKTRISRCFTLSLCLLLIPGLASPQEDESGFKWALDNVNMAYELPTGFHPTKIFPKSAYIYYPNANKANMFDASSYCLMNKDSIIIDFEQYMLRADPYEENDSVINTYYLNWKNRLENFQLIAPDKLKEVHATAGAIYRTKVTYPYRKEYWFLKTIYLQRQDIGGFKIRFLAKDSTRKFEVNRLIKSTWGMLWFKPDSAFHPAILKNELIGKFRQMRPNLKGKDSAERAASNKLAVYTASMMNGKFAEGAKKWEKARAHFLQAHDLLPKEFKPITSLFLMNMKLHRLDSATHYWQMLHDVYLPHHPKLKTQLKFGLVMLYDKKGRYDSAIVVSKQLIRLRPHDLHAYSALAEQYKNKDEYHSAIATYRKALEVSSEKSSLKQEQNYFNFQIGLCYQKISQPQKAKKYFLKAKEGGYDLPGDIREKYGLQ